MNYEEKLIRFIASKLIQRRYFMAKGEFPGEVKLSFYIKRVLAELKEKYRELKYVRIHSKTGLITPAILDVVSKMKF
jgi:hypothetical protein